MVKIKLQDIISHEASLVKLLEIKLPVKASYRIKRLIDKLQPELKTFVEKRMELFKEYGVHDEEKDTYSVENISKSAREEFDSKIIELLELEVNIDFEKLKIDELGDVKIEPKLLIDFVFE